MEGLGMSKTLKELSPETMRVLNKVKAREEMKKYSECRASWEMQNLINSVDIKAKTNHYKEMGEEFHARMEKVIREGLSEFELNHLEVRITSQRLQRSLAETSPANVSEGKYSVDYGVDSSLIRREKTSQVDKSNKYIEGWKIPEGGEIRLLKDCSFGYSRHYRLDTEAELSPEDVEKIKESCRKGRSIDLCPDTKEVEESMRSVIGIDWGEGVLEKLKWAANEILNPTSSETGIAEPAGGSEEPGRGLDESRGVYREKPALEAKSCGCVGNYICWECRL
jgi:hypothetical protein